MSDSKLDIPLPSALRPRWIRLLAVALVAITILYLSVTPPGQQQAQSPDKLQHLIGYSVLTLASVYAVFDLDIDPRITVGGTILATVLYGVAMEIIQSTLEYRAFETGDMYANASGALLVALLLMVYSRVS